MRIEPKEIKIIKSERVYFNDVETRLLKELKRYWYNRMPSKYDPLQPYLDNIDQAEYFEIVNVRSNNVYVDGICLVGDKFYNTTYLSLKEIRQWFLKHGVINGKRYSPQLVRNYYGAISLHHSDRKKGGSN